MANAGRVELDLVAVGRDEVSAMLRKIDGQARKTAASMKASLNDGAAEGVSKLQATVKRVGDGAGKAFAVISRAANILPGLGIGGALLGIVAGFEALGRAIGGSSLAAERWDKAVEGMNEGLKTTQSILDEINAALGTGPDSMDKLLSKARDRSGELNEQIAAGEIELRNQKERLEDIHNLFPYLSDDQAQFGETQADINKLKSQQYLIEKAIGEALDDQAKKALAADHALRRMVATLRGQVAWEDPENPLGSSLNPFGDAGVVDDFKAAQNELKRIASESNKFVDGLTRTSGRTAKKEKAEAPDHTDLIQRLHREATEIGAALDAAESSGSGVAMVVEGLERPIDKLATAFDTLNTAAATVGQTMPDVGDALAEVGATIDRIAESHGSLTDALVHGGAALAAHVAKAIGGVRAEAAVRAAYELAMGFATLSNPPVSAGHFTAAALLGAVAAGAGGGGGGSRSAGSGGSASAGGGASGGGSGSGPTTVVYNISSLVTDPYQLQRATSAASRSNRGTGIGARAGV